MKASLWIGAIFVEKMVAWFFLLVAGNIEAVFPAEIYVTYPHYFSLGIKLLLFRMRERWAGFYHEQALSFSRLFAPIN